MTEKLTLTGDSLRDPQDSVTSQVDQSEDRMRRALEQLGGGSRPARPQRQAAATETFPASRKHRFVQDGDVTVTHAQTRRDRPARSVPQAAAQESVFPGSRDAGLRESLAEERGLRLRAERTAQEAQSAIATLQTKLGHAEIALAEARDNAAAESEALARLQAELQGRDVRIESLQERLDAAEAERRKLAQDREAMSAAEAPAGPKPAAPKPLRTNEPARRMSKATRSVVQAQKARGADADDPKPVKWWLPGNV